MFKETYLPGLMLLKDQVNVNGELSTEPGQIEMVQKNSRVVSMER